MDRYEFNLKVEQLNKLVKSGDYKAAMRITDTIDWSRVHNAGLLTTVSEVYEKNAEYKEAREILLLAYDRAPVGKRALYRLTMLAIKEGDISEAQAYYDEYIEISPQDSRKYLMEYYIAEAKGKDINKKIRILEKYCDIEKMDEQWKYELALLYAKVGRIEDCIKTCDEIMLLFGVGEYVEKAATLKESTGCPLSTKQQEQVDNKEYYEDRLNTIAKKYESGDRENYPNLNLDDMSAYKPREERKTTINLSDEEEITNENTHINTELFPKAVGINEIRISETTFKGESVNPEFEVELKRAIAITNENLNRMKGESDHSSMAEIDEEVRAHMEKVERIKHGRFIAPPIMAERRKSRISNHFDSMGLPKTHGNRDEYRDLVGNTQRTWISEEREDKFVEDEIIPDGNKLVEDEPIFEEKNSQEFQFEDIHVKEAEIKEDIEDISENKEILSEDIADIEKEDELRADKIDLINISKNIAKNNENVEDNKTENDGDIAKEDKEPTENVTVTETASTKVLENYVPEKKVPIFDNDDLINSYFDEEIDTGVPTVSSVMAKRKEQRDIVQSSVKSETKMEVVDDEEIYYTKEERTFVTKVKKGEEPEEIVIEPEFKEVDFDNEKFSVIISEDTKQTTISENNDVRKLSGSHIEEDSQSVGEDEEDSKENDTISIEENEDDEIREVDLPVHGKVMKARAPKSKEPKEYLMRRPGSIMVEGVTAQKALENAKEVLREVNELTKIKHSVLKIGAVSLNNRGVMNSIDKIKGKDLIIVEAGKLDDNIISELIEFIRNGKETVVFADTRSGISSLIEANDLLHGMSLIMREEEAPVKRKNVVANIVLKEKDHEKELEEKKETDSKGEKQEDTSAVDLEALEVIANLYGWTDINIQGIGSSDSIKFYNGEPKKEVLKVEEEKAKYMVDMAERKKAKEEEPKEEKQTVKLEPVISEAKDEKPVKLEKQTEEENEEEETELKPFDIEYPDEDNVQMGVDQFIAYALKYVEEIECVLSYKTEYAIEERADYMKEDGTPLTKKNARNMIDHAADVAERPGLMKAILSGLTNSKYDKEGRLILREEHFKI